MPDRENCLVCIVVYYVSVFIYLFGVLRRFQHCTVCLFGVLRRFQHCTGDITTGSWKGRGNQYIQFARVVYCKLPTNGKQLPAFPLKAMTGIEPRPQRWEARVLPLCHRDPLLCFCKAHQTISIIYSKSSIFYNSYTLYLGAVHASSFRIFKDMFDNFSR